MVCDRCGREEPALKTVCRRDDAGRVGVLCDPCWGPVREMVWIVPGVFPVWGWCNSCQGWCSLRDLPERSGGGRYDAPQGLCSTCAV